MAKPEFSLFHHPTTTVYIDDNKDFLNSLTMKLVPGSFKAFDKPVDGLSYIESQFKLSENFSKGLPMSPDLNTPNKLVLPQNQVCQKLNTLNRFAEPSVVVVDFSMPELNGLDLCSQLTNPYTKKILLTGVANERQAIHALNSDLIDFFTGKNEDELSKRLEAIVGTLNTRYFMDMMLLSNHEARSQIPFLYDEEFADYFEQTCEDLNVVEYYYVTNPGGFLLIDAFGTISRLIVMTPNDHSNALKEIRKMGASKECLSRLDQAEDMPFFQDDNGKTQEKYLSEWQKHLYPLFEIQGNDKYLCTLLKKQTKCLTCYQEYLDMPSNRLH